MATGWQFGGGYEDRARMVDALSLYEVLLDEVIPMYYEDRSLARDDASQHLYGATPLLLETHAHSTIT